MSGTGASLTIENAFLNTNGGLATTPYNWTSSMGGAMVFISNSAIFVTQGTISVPLIRFINTDARLTALNSHIGTNVVDAMIDLMRIDSRTPDRIAFINCSFFGSIDITSSAGMTTNAKFSSCSFIHTKFSDADVLFDIHSGTTVFLTTC